DESYYENIIKEYHNNKSVLNSKKSSHLSHQSSEVEEKPKINSKLTEALLINSDGHETKDVSSSPVLARSKSMTSLARLIHIQPDESYYENIIKEYHNNKSVLNSKKSSHLSHQSSEVEEKPKINSKLTEALLINSDGHETKDVSSSPVLARSKSMTSLARLIHIQPDESYYENIIKEYHNNKSVSNSKKSSHLSHQSSEVEEKPKINSKLTEAILINSNGHRKRKFNESSLPKSKKVKLLGSSSITFDTSSIEKFIRPRTQIATVEKDLVKIIQGTYKYEKNGVNDLKVEIIPTNDTNDFAKTRYNTSTDHRLNTTKLSTPLKRNTTKDSLKNNAKHKKSKRKLQRCTNPLKDNSLKLTSVFSELTDQDHKRLACLKIEGNQDRVHGTISIELKVDGLFPLIANKAKNKLITSEIIACYSDLLMNMYDNIFIIDSSFWIFFENNVSYATSWRGRYEIDPFSHEKVFIIINVKSQHWASVYVHTREKKLFWLDSLEETYGQDSIAIENLIKVLNQDSNNYQLTKLNIPQQENSYDCGVFMMCCIRHIAANVPLTYNGSQIKQFRSQIALELLDKTLLPIEYLNQQSYIATTRLSNESSIYKSIKSVNLICGLDIRYDHYKLRNGNLNDIWVIVLQNLKNGVGYKGISIDDEFLKFEVINFNILSFENEGIESINIPLSYKIDKKWIIVVLIGFISQITINFYDSKLEKPTNGKNINDINIVEDRGSLESDCKYTLDKDKGIAIKLQDVLNNQIYTNIEFTQLNIISAIASTIKHLPSTKLEKYKTIEIIPSNESNVIDITNLIVKLLFSFIQNLEIHINTKPSYKYDLTSIPEQVILQNKPIKLSLIQNLKLFLLNHGIFNSSKLIYIESNSLKNLINSKDLNKFKIKHSSNIIKEFLNPLLVGPVLVTDIYEYRTYGSKYGSIPQNLEMKIINLNNHQNLGKLMIRGYNIGKFQRFINNQIELTNQRENDGFMPLQFRENVKWGNDGCLYFDC
ncbi:uncharacterized protein KGF55_000074, partial [Candida pseudojiufengensis]|uniref:uncharacterized protein n=1 Tax=Candida pseudojiufengensis TaxID=497109 RepID=UPI002223F35D